jgi:long-chain acyl-CoA synthetase
VAVLLTVNRREVRKEARTDEEVHALVAQVVAEVNRQLGPEERVRRFAVLERDFLPEKGEVTPTLKLKRSVIEDRLRDEIDALYATSRTRLPGDDADD